ncbi:hypothetical protein TcasGA2_TC008978 [Tribolium castaneum]|uniref:Uncharacterized protein n=1 Tax=Tribolium castaneum TaxID=7070 RepID=D6WQ36_TRICA|nr:hypothetical protein TcasGA2_TC008978 [Tribolium castaneum]
MMDKQKIMRQMGAFFGGFPTCAGSTVIPRSQKPASPTLSFMYSPRTGLFRKLSLSYRISSNLSSSQLPQVAGKPSYFTVNKPSQSTCLAKMFAKINQRVSLRTVRGFTDY